MNEITKVRRLILTISSYVLISLILLWFVIPAKAFIAGLILGGLISFYNTLYLARRVRIAGQSVASGSPRLAGTGLIHRVLMVAFGILLAYRLPDWIDYRSVPLGLPIGYILLVIAVLIHIKNEEKKRERRVMFGNHSENSFSRPDV